MSDPAVVALIGSVGLIVGPLSVVILNEWIKIRREAKEVQKQHREAVSEKAVKAQESAITIKDRELELVRNDRDRWQARSEHLESLLYGQDGRS